MPTGTFMLKTAQQMRLFKIRDLRQKEKFVVDDFYLNGYGKILGPTISAVYFSLCRHANKNQESYPNEMTIASEWDITDRTARRAIKILRECRIIATERERTAKGKWLNNVYILLDKSEWLKPEDIRFRWRTRGHKRTKPEDIKRKTRGHPCPLKETQYKDITSITSITRVGRGERGIVKGERGVVKGDKCAVKTPTPAQKAKLFFENPDFRSEVIAEFVKRGGKEDQIRKEIEKFIFYWTEPNKSGTKQRWELEKTFDITRRLFTWFRRAGEFAKRDRINLEI